ncbi:MAG TPA: hypothetical protein VJ914_25035 [Pseudonocardiaceae bacterium]|nr:hypothetical protein [Pseudonocardiaceae bacterium]
MSYDLVVWDGQRPATDDEALTSYISLIETYLEDDPTPPGPKIVRYLDALLARWPNSELGRLWAAVPLAEDASGPIICLNLMRHQAEQTAKDVADLAQAHGLVCFDPQEGRLMP